jgi:site-specific DNA-methyltransferase (adenine-specific)
MPRARVAAVKLGLRFTGIEIEPHYYQPAFRRISDALRQPDMFIEKPKPAKQVTML